MPETMTLAELERELKEARLRGAEDHTPVFKRLSDMYVAVTDIIFDGTIRIK